jgi:hypothetical protein
VVSGCFPPFHSRHSHASSSPGPSRRICGCVSPPTP